MSDCGSDLEIGHASNGSERVRQETRRLKKKKNDQSKQVANKKKAVSQVSPQRSRMKMP